MPSFRRVVEALGTAWETERETVLAQADALVDAVRREVRLAESMTESESESGSGLVAATGPRRRRRSSISS